MVYGHFSLLNFLLQTHLENDNFPFSSLPSASYNQDSVKLQTNLQAVTEASWRSKIQMSLHEVRFHNLIYVTIIILCASRHV